MSKGLRGFVDDALSRTGSLAVEKSGDFPTARPFAHKPHRALFVSYKIPEGQNQPQHRSVDRNWQGSTYPRAFSVRTNGATSVDRRVGRIQVAVVVLGSELGQRPRMHMLSMHPLARPKVDKRLLRQLVLRTDFLDLDLHSGVPALFFDLFKYIHVSEDLVIDLENLAQHVFTGSRLIHEPWKKVLTNDV